MNIPRSAFKRAAVLAYLASTATLPAQDPGRTGPPQCATLFRPGVRSIAVAVDGKTVHFPQRHSFLMISRLRNGEWGAPEPIPFSQEYEQGDPFFSPDGTQLFFWSTRPREGAAPVAGSPDIWVSKASAGGWGAPRCLDITIEGKRGGSVFPSVTAAGDLYFCSRRASLGKRDLFRARKEGDGFGAPENLGPPLNTPADEFDATVSADGNTLVFCRGRETFGCDLYVSKREDGAWTAPRKLGPELHFGNGPCAPALSPDGRWLHFTSFGGNGHEPGIYRISAEVLSGPRSKTRLKATPLAPDRISRHGAFGLTFTPDGRTACFAERHSFILESRLVDGAWTRPEPLPFTFVGLNTAPSLSPDGSSLFFVSTKPAPEHSPQSAGATSIWATCKAGAVWVEPRRLGNLLNEKIDCYVDSPSAAADGTLFFTGIRGMESMNSQLYSARPSGGGYLPGSLAAGLNLQDQDQAEACVSPAGDTLVFSSDRLGGLGGYDLYQSRRSKDGAWGLPQNLGPTINSPGTERSPALGEEGRTLYFFSDRDGTPGIYKAPLPF